MTERIKSLAELEKFAASCAGTLARKGGGATLITLSGELGAGKTAFVKAFAKALGVEEHVTSPTFVLEKIYALPNPKGDTLRFERLIHIDAYRLKDGGELAALGFDEAMSAPENLILLEWPERVADALPEAALALAFVAEKDGSRSVSYE